MAQNASHELISHKKAFQDALLTWYRANARVLPWRSDPSLYKTVLSEFMLQQTQIKTALPYFHRWLIELPSFEALAIASSQQVLKLWEGLGYYTRARNIHRLAQALVAMPNIPKTPEAWLELPGVGPYTAAAITSIAFKEPLACVDGNVVRILSRLTATSREFLDSASASKYFAPLGQALINSENPGDHNQAMMELGATVCHRRSPACLLCPVKAFCAGTKKTPESFPKLTQKKIEKKEIVRIWCIKDGSLLLHRASAQAKRLSGIHELPTASQVDIDEDKLKPSDLIFKKVRTITRFQMQESIYRISRIKNKLSSSLVWIPFTTLSKITLSGPHKRWISEIQIKQKNPPSV